MNMWIKPAGANAWHLFNKNMPAALCGLRFEGMGDGPRAVIPDGEAACEACKIAAVGQANATRAEIHAVCNAIEEVTADIRGSIFFGQHSAAALNAILTNPDDYNIVSEDGNIDLTSAAILAHAAASEASRVMADCDKNHLCPGDAGSDDGEPTIN